MLKKIFAALSRHTEPRAAAGPSIMLTIELPWAGRQLRRVGPLEELLGEATVDEVIARLVSQEAHGNGGYQLLPSQYTLHVRRPQDSVFIQIDGSTPARTFLEGQDDTGIMLQLRFRVVPLSAGARPAVSQDVRPEEAVEPQDDADRPETTAAALPPAAPAPVAAGPEPAPDLRQVPPAGLRHEPALPIAGIRQERPAPDLRHEAPAPVADLRHEAPAPTPEAQTPTATERLLPLGEPQPAEEEPAVDVPARFGMRHHDLMPLTPGVEDLPASPAPETEPAPAEKKAGYLRKADALWAQLHPKIEALDFSGLFVGNFGLSPEAMVKRPRVALISAAEANQYLMQGNQHRREGRFEQAAQCYRTLITNFPENADYWFLLGKVEDENNNPTGALRAFQNAQRLGHTGAREEIIRLEQHAGVGEGRQDLVSAWRQSFPEN